MPFKLEGWYFKFIVPPVFTRKLFFLLPSSMKSRNIPVSLADQCCWPEPFTSFIHDVYIYFCTGATNVCALRLFQVKFDTYLLKWILEIKENGGFREFWNCETVHVLSVYIFYGTVVSEFKRDLDTVKNCLHSHHICPGSHWDRHIESLKCHGGISKQWNSVTAWSYMVHIRNRFHRMPWHCRTTELVVLPEQYFISLPSDTVGLCTNSYYLD